jgi:hypothetical protein
MAYTEKSPQQTHLLLLLLLLLILTGLGKSSYKLLLEITKVL